MLPTPDKFIETAMKELQDFEMKIKDGTLAGCVVYHEAVRAFFVDVLKHHKERVHRETIEAVRLEEPEEVDCDDGYITGRSNKGKRLTHNKMVGYKIAVDDLNTNIKSLGIDV